MVKMMKQILLIFLILLAGSAWGTRSVMMSELTPDTSHESNIGKNQEHTNLKQLDREDKTQKPTVSPSIKGDKFFSENSHPYKEFDINEILESIFKPFQSLFEPNNKKPKVKTVVSLTELVGPKHPVLPPFHSDPISSQFGVKEVGLMDDPFCLDFGKFLPGFMPKISKVDFIWPMKHNREKHGDNLSNFTDMEFSPFFPGHRHHSKSDLNIFPRLDNLEDKNRNTPSLFIKGSSGEAPLVSLGEIKLDEAVATNGDEVIKDKMCNLVKALPYMEGAIGGVMFVMLILVIASWRIRKPNGIWARVPFVDKSQYIEKV